MTLKKRVGIPDANTPLTTKASTIFTLTLLARPPSPLKGEEKKRRTGKRRGEKGGSGRGKGAEKKKLIKKSVRLCYTQLS